MKVLQINSVCGYGSTGKIVVDLYNILKEDGQECKISYGRGNAPKNIETIKIGNKLDILWHVLLSRIFDKQCYGSKIATKKLVKQIKEYNPDVIHLHNIHGYYINVKILFNYLAKANKKVIWTLHDCWSFTGHCTHFDYVKCNKWKSICETCPEKFSYPKSILWDNCKNNYKLKKQLFNQLKDLTLVTPSTWLANLTKQSLFSRYNVKVIPNGIDLNIFKPMKSNIRDKLKLNNKKVILGVASTWKHRKGLDIFIELSKKLDDSYKIVLIGLSDKEKKHIPKNIISISRTNDIEELVKYYTMADVFVNPTLEDNFPTTNLEALACGIPIVTFNTGGSPECIDETCGLVVEKGDIEGLIKGIKEIINIGIPKENCIKKSKDYDKYKQFYKYLELYKN